jgi:hypothetical protein
MPHAEAVPAARPTKFGCDPSGIDRSLECVSGNALLDYRLMVLPLRGAEPDGRGSAAGGFAPGTLLWLISMPKKCFTALPSQAVSQGGECLR